MADPYRIPSPYAGAPTIHGWLLEALQEGQAWLQAQRPPTEWDRVINALSAPEIATDPGDRYPKTNRLAREMVASLANFRPEGEFTVQHDQSLHAQASALTKIDQAWSRSNHAFTQYRRIMQYGVAHGTGYGVCEWNRSFHSPFLGDVALQAMAPDDVYFVQLPKDHDIQKAYLVILRYELPINLARRTYMGTNEDFARQLQPDRDEPGWLEKGLRKIQALIGGSPIFALGDRQRRQRGSFPTVDIFHAYTVDDSINTTGSPVTMGAYRTNWEYEVPSYGSDIPSGVVQNGTMLTRKATESDSLLFPLRRLSIFSRSVPFPCYDGSSPWWHGKAPLVRIRFNDWAWEALGRSLLGDVLPTEKTNQSIMKDIEDSSAARLDPPLVYDDSLVTKQWAEAVNPRRAGVRAGGPLSQSKLLQVIGEQWQYEMPTWIPDWVKQQEARMDYYTGTPDLVAIAKAKQVPSEGTLEKILEMAGPLVQDMVRCLEEPLVELAEMRKAYYFQFYTVNRMLRIAGQFGEEASTFAFTPDLIQPLKADEAQAASRSPIKRYLHEFSYTLSQSSLNELHRLSTKLFYLQLMKAGFPISWWTFAKIAQIPNFGPEPMGKDNKPVTNEMERWIAQKHIERELAEEIGATQQGQRGAGRPPTNQAAPRIVQKDQGTRSTVATSR